MVKYRKNKKEHRMRSRGIARRVDELGRIVIPKEIRKKLDITDGTSLEIHLDGNTIIMQKDVSVCVFCGSESADTEFKGKKICPACRAELKA